MIKKISAVSASLFIIGFAGLLGFYFLVEKPLENYFAFILILAIAMLPKIFLEFFMISKNVNDNFLIGYLRFFVFFMIFSTVYDWIFFSTATKFPFVCLFIAIVFFLWGKNYDAKNIAEKEN